MTTTLNDTFLDSLPIKITYVGEILRAEWPHDLWSVELYKARESYHRFDYKTGLGLRKANKRFMPHTMAGTPKPVKPSVLDVLESLFGDADCAKSTFTDFCSDLGYSDDSIKALGIYKTCCDTAVALRKYFTKEQTAEIRRLLEERNA